MRIEERMMRAFDRLDLQASRKRSGGEPRTLVLWSHASAGAGDWVPIAGSVIVGAQLFRTQGSQRIDTGGAAGGHRARCQGNCCNAEDCGDITSHIKWLNPVERRRESVAHEH